MGINVNELQKEYEKEFSEFLIQKINHAGGSLQFQHLSGLLQQLRFEIRDAFGVTKSELMKFLRAHSDIFKVNSKGIVTTVNFSALNSSDCPNEEKNQNTYTKKLLKNGKGFILKRFHDYAIIKATSPLKTYIFFTPLEYGADKDSLFVDMDLDVRDAVCFNAIHGHSDYEIEYRATKVWRDPDSDDENPHAENLRGNKVVKTKKFAGEGIIKKLFPSVGFIYILGKEKIFFYRSSIKDHDIKLGDKVEFVAEYISNEWQATEIIKKRKGNITESSDHSQTYTRSTDKHNVSEEKLKSHPGKIYPYSKGAVIKFGKNYSELADCNTCIFYLYGIRVAIPDIAMEFSEGDDVKFDAVKSKNSPGWKAVVVWVGDKPVGIENDQKISERNYRINEDTNANPADIASDVSSEISDLIRRTRRNSNNKNNNKEENNINEGHKLHNKSKSRFDSRINRSLNRFSEEHHKDNIVTSKMPSKKLLHIDSKCNQNKDKKRHRTRRSNRKYNQDKSFQRSSVFNNTEENDESLPICKNSVLDMLESSETASEENNELQDSPPFPRKFLIEDGQCLIDESEKNEIYSENESDEDLSESDKNFAKRRSSIKKFEAIDGVIISLFCKFAIIKSDHLEKEVDFILNAFYLNGKSVEEQQVIDLKEVIKVGDIIKFNCFEIIDDYGEIHQKVTMAWKGLKPNVHEINPEEFILEHDLCVSIGDEQDYEYESEESFDTTRSRNFEEACDLNSEVESSQNNRLLDTSCGYPVVSESNIHQNLSSDVQPEKLPDIILRKLETCGFISSEPEVGISELNFIEGIFVKIQFSDFYTFFNKINTINNQSHLIKVTANRHILLSVVCPPLFYSKNK